MKKLKVVHLNRKRSLPGSIEILFSTIRKFIPGTINVEYFTPSCESKGLLRRLFIVIESYFHQGDINHITGDIHFASFLLKKEKTILTVHDCVSVIHSKGLKRAMLKLFWFTLPLKRVQYVTAISEKTKEELLSLVNFPEERIFVIPDCISDQFKYVTQKNFNKKKPRNLQIGTKTNKNLIRVCEALKDTRCVLDIVGKLSDEQIDALKNNKITYENSWNIKEEELIQKYIDANIIAFVSTYEGFGMPILEAQTVGRPVLTRSISPMVEVAGNGAYSVDPFCVKAIRDGFLKLINDDSFRDVIVMNGLRNIKKYKPGAIAEMYVDLYRRVKEPE